MCFCITGKVLISLIGIVLQLIGSIILIIRKCVVPEKQQLKELEDRRAKVENESLSLEKSLTTDEELKREIFITRVSLLLLIVGTLLSIVALFL